MFLGVLRGGTVNLEISPASEPRHQKSDLVQVQSRIMNLAPKGRDALLSSGILAIETKTVALDEPCDRESASLSAGRCVLLSASNADCRMDESNRKAWTRTRRSPISPALYLSTRPPVFARNYAWVRGIRYTLSSTNGRSGPSHPLSRQPRHEPEETVAR